jgi:cytochrome c
VTPKKLAVLALLLPALAGAAEYATTKDAELLVHRAVAFYKKAGRAKALAAFNEPAGPFSYRDLYVFAYALDGTCLAHSAQPDRVGRNLIKDRDADGKEFVRERIAIAGKEGKGWQEYRFLNPATRRIEKKVAYFEVVDRVVLVAGAYRR